MSRYENAYDISKNRNYFEDPFARQIDDDSRCEYLIDHHTSITRESSAVSSSRRGREDELKILNGSNPLYREG